MKVLNFKTAKEMRSIITESIAVFLLLATAACSKIELTSEIIKSEVSLVPVTLSASITESKATVNQTGQVFWQDNDQILVWVDSTDEPFTMTLENGAGTKSATFKGLLPEGANVTRAAGPKSALNNDGSFKAIPKQTISEGQTSDPNALLMLSEAPEDGVLHFKNQCGALRFNVDAGIVQVSVYSNEVNCTATLPGSAGTYDVFFATGDYTNLLFTATDSAGNTYGATTTKTLTVKRSVITNLSSISLVPCTLIKDAESLQEYLSSPEKNGYFVDDIDLTDIDLTPCTSFAKTLDGRGHSIANWTCKKALITSLTGEVRNITIASTCSMQPDSPDNMGFIISEAKADSKVSGCTNKANISIDDSEGKTSRLGALIGRSTNGYIENCSNEGNMKFTLGGLDGTQYIGGIVGINGTETQGKIRIKNCHNKGKITFTVNGTTGKNCYVGGIVGASGTNGVSGSETTKNYGTIDGCTNSGDMTFNHPNGGSSIYMQMAGIAGYFEGVINNCTNSGKIELQNSYTVSTARPAIGGICGTLTISASNCINKGDIIIKGMFANGTATASGAAGIITSSFGGVFGNIGNATLSDNCFLDGCENYGKLSVDATMPSANKSTHRVGGVVGQSYAILKNCRNEGEIDATLGSYTNGIGGIASYTFANVDKCINTGNISVKGIDGFTGNQSYQMNTGGIIGYIASDPKTTVTNCHNTGNIEMTNLANKVYHYAGGLVGNYNKGVDLTECQAECNITGNTASGIRLGGLAGAINGTIDSCSYEGNVSLHNATALTEKEASAGLCAGYNNGAIKNSSFKGKVLSTSAAGTSIGGILGNSGSSNTTRNITNTTVEVALTSGNSTVGAVVGRLNATSTYCYLGDTGKPVTLKSCTINGSAVSDTEQSTLIGDTKSSQNISIKNVVIQNN